MSENKEATESPTWTPIKDENCQTLLDFVQEDETDDVIKESHWYSYGGNKFHASYWRPKKLERSDLKAVIFLTHGYGEYLNFVWEELARTLAVDCQALVFGHDHVGHGRTTGPRVQVDSMDEYIDPILAHLDFIKAAKDVCPSGLPVFLYGHSLGGLMSLFVLFKRQDDFKGFAASGPCVAIDPDLNNSLFRLLARVLQGVMPNFSIKKLEAELVTRDPEVVRQIVADPLIWKGGFKARHSWVIMQAVDYAQNNLPNIKLPMIVLQGEKDKLVLPEGSKMLVDNASSVDKEYVSYPDAYHNVTVETEDVKTDALKRVQEFFNRLIDAE